MTISFTMTPFVFLEVWDIFETNEKANSNDLISLIQSRFPNCSKEDATRIIQRALESLIEMKLIEQTGDNKYIIVKSVQMNLIDFLARGLSKKTREIANDVSKPLPQERIREMLVENTVGLCLGDAKIAYHTPPTKIKVTAPDPINTEYTFIVCDPKNAAGAVNQYLWTDHPNPPIFILNDSVIKNLGPIDLSIFDDDVSIAASDGSLDFMSLPNPVAPTDTPTLSIISLSVASSAFWLGTFNRSKIVENEFLFLPDITDINDSSNYEAITSSDLFNVQTNDSHVQSYYRMLELHDSIDALAFNNHNPRFFIRDGPMVPHSYVRAKESHSDALERAESLSNLAID
jgi:hypothetical protein